MSTTPGTPLSEADAAGPLPENVQAFIDQHPEALVGGAFAITFLFAKLLRALGS